MTLQQRFIESKGEALQIEGISVTQMDRLPISSGVIRVEFFGGESDLVCGVAIKSSGGHIVLSDGLKVKLLHVWDEKSLPKVVEHEVRCPDGELKVWNVYRMIHNDGLVTEDCWTNNSCMRVDRLGSNSRRYSCSDGIGEVNLRDHVFVISWRSDE